MARKIEDLVLASAAADADLAVIHQDTTDIDRKITLETIKDYVLASVFPVGTVYTQLPGKDDPTTLGYPGTWTNISSSFAGEFFRAEGGSASTFESGEQLDAFQGHRHTLRRPPWITAERNSSTAVWGPTGGPYTYGTYSGSVRDPESDDSNGTPRTASETRPVNVTIRLWERTA